MGALELYLANLGMLLGLPLAMLRVLEDANDQVGVSHMSPNPELSL